MKKHAFLITSAFSAMLLLAACNSTETPTPTEEEETAGTVNETNNTQNGAAEGEDTTADTGTEETNESTNTIEYVENGQPKKAETVTTVSPQQDYTISLAKGFSLEAEEPGRDMVMYDANNEHSMRIELFAKDETTYEEAALQTENTVKITAPEGKYEPYALDSLLTTHKDITNANGYVVTYTEDKDQVVTVVFEKGTKIVRLTVFDTTTAEMTDAFLQMGFTIE
ncbi:hypothetical protein AAGS61_00020 [Lysinibacillus sp. KU-BSD001]|uniref:hypothetical protein n=1 Tax=Lysinibacillus sp. KU-BSD001 TaxID=3141328 RepID=UPI0036EE267A